MKAKGLICVMLLLCCMTAKAFDFQQNGFYYNILRDGISVEVTFADEMAGSYTGNIVIPEKVTHNGTTYKVTQIGDAAFFKCSGVSSVTIPNSVKHIGVSAFFACTGLKSLSLPDGIEHLGQHAFASCSNLESIMMPRRIKYIWKEIFKGCSNLSVVTIPSLENFVRFDSKVFDDCRKITKISVPVGSKERVQKMLPQRLWNVIVEQRSQK